MNTSFCSLWNSYKSLKKSYYDIDIKTEDLFGEEAKRECYYFIHNHFVHGCKEDVFDVDFLNKFTINGKHEHTTALYLMGLLMQSVFFSKIKDDLCKIGINGDNWYTERDYMYTWYLTCLYHDTACCAEELENQTFPCCNCCIARGKNPYTNKTVFRKKKPHYSKATIKNYCFYRISNGKIDHSIHAGMLVYGKLYNNFKKKTRNHNWKDNSVCTHDGLIWRREHLDHFAYVADAIICHNMWTVQKTDAKGVKKYKKYHLDELIVHSDADRLSINEYPLQFMLCLLDTIEPVKRFEQLTAREVLENISIELSDSRIQIAWTEKIKQQPEFKTWMGNITTVNDWMQVDVSTYKKEGEWDYVTINIR